MSTRPSVWQLVRDAAVHFNREVTYSEIKQFVWTKYPDVNSSTLTCQIIVCSVNHPSRIHYPENKKPRVCTGQYDFLYHTGRGRITLYDGDRHGQWEIAETPDSRLVVRLVHEGFDETGAVETGDAPSSIFALESHLRDYLAKNLPRIADFGIRLSVFKSDDGRDGVEFQTDVGPIDLLTVTPAGDFYVFELKLGRGPDSALGQILRYMGWVAKHIAKDRKVYGVYWPPIFRRSCVTPLLRCLR